MKGFLEGVKIALLCLVVLVIAGAGFYMCEILPMQECMDQGHSFMYCQKLLNK